MNSRVIGVMLIIGPILTMGTWLFYNVETSEMNVSETLNALLAEENKAQMCAMIRMFGLTSMFMGLYFLARSLKSDNSISNVCSEIGGLLLLLAVPIWVILQGSDIGAISSAKEFGNNEGEAILAAGKMTRMVFFLFTTGIFILGIALSVVKRYEGIVGLIFRIVGGLFIITSLIGILQINDGIAWLGMFALTLVSGILTLLKKDS